MAGIVMPGGRVGIAPPPGIAGKAGIEARLAATIRAELAMRAHRSFSVVFPFCAIVAIEVVVPLPTSSPLRPVASASGRPVRSVAGGRPSAALACRSTAAWSAQP